MLFIIVPVNVLVILIHPIVMWLLVRIKRKIVRTEFQGKFCFAKNGPKMVFYAFLKFCVTSFAWKYKMKNYLYFTTNPLSDKILILKIWVK